MTLVAEQTAMMNAISALNMLYLRGSAAKPPRDCTAKQARLAMV
jgi:hypothetical protein